MTPVPSTNTNGAADPTLGGAQQPGVATRAVALVAAVSAVVGVVVGLLVWLLLAGPVVALLLAVVVAAAVAALTWWGSEALILRLVGASPADPIAHARLFNLVEGLGAGAGVAPPTLLVVADPALNAMTIGRSPRQATLIVTSGLLEQLNRVELEGVLAHELSHVRSDDVLSATLAVTLFGLWARPARAAAASGPSAMAATLLVPICALAGLGLQKAVAPNREQQADAAGVRLTRYPPGMVSALEKVRRSGSVLGGGGASPATAHLWLCAPVPPPGGRLAWLSRLYETHPRPAERIEALREL
ncbi:MAG: M48 family metalloprotease [Acidimicrobiales bacterium]